MKKKIKLSVLKTIAMAMLLMVSAGVHAAEVVYRIVEYNKSTQDFILSASGQVPKGAYAWFENEYGATTGNRYNQIPRNKKAMLWLSGWQGCTIKGITFSMCSNNKRGQVGFSVHDGEKALYTFRPCDFADDAWFGQWVSKDLGVYVDIAKVVEAEAFASDLANITLQGGTGEGSVYVDAITIDYDEAPGSTLESPLGWSYEKLEKKSTLQEGDELMIFRNGYAAADIDGMQSDSHYLDAIAVASTGDVSDPEVLRFTLNKSADNTHWMLTDQHGRKLGAKGKGALAWDEGVTTWTIALDYEGATIASTNTAYGTLRFNAPAESYARFNLYTSKSLPLPFLYRKAKQNEAVVSSSLSLDVAEMTVALSEGYVALKPTVSPKAVTDHRIVWTSSNEAVATVNGGFVTLKAEGSTIITARMMDGGAETTLLLTVAGDDTGISSTTAEARKSVVRKVADEQGIVITTPCHRYGVNGVERR